MELYIMGALSILLCAFLTGLCVQVIRIEKSISKLAIIIQQRVSSLIHQAK
jgi:hypothetical protein